MMAFYDVMTFSIQKGRGQLHCDGMMLYKKKFWNQPLDWYAEAYNQEAGSLVLNLAVYVQKIIINEIREYIPYASF